MSFNSNKTKPVIIGIIGGTELLGAERGLIEALRALKESGAKIIVGVSNRSANDNPVEKMCLQLGFKTFQLPFGSHFSKKWMLNAPKYRKRQIKRILSCSQILLQNLKIHSPDSIILGSTLAFNFVAPGLLINRTPLIFRVGDAPITKSKYQMFIWKILAHRAHHLVCISQYIHNSIQPHIRKTKNTTIIKNIPPKRLSTIDRRKIAQLKMSKRPSQGVYVGQISDQKGVPDLVEALIQLNDPTVSCWIIGASKFTQKYEIELTEKIKLAQTETEILLLGYINDPRPHLNAADWHIAPSKITEALGNVVIEAKEQGTPSVVSPIGGLPENVTPHKTGWIMNGTGTHAITETLLQVKREISSIKEQDLNEEAKNNSFLHYQKQWFETVMRVSKLPL